MSEINAKIIKLKIISANIIVSRRPLKRLEVSVECRAKLKTPGEQDNKSVLLNIELSVGAKNDDLKIEFDADTIFELDQIPDDYNMIAEQKLIPLARTVLFEKLDEMLVSMGYEKMKLAEQM